MYKVGITGGIGAGKSTVTRVFQLFGTPIYDADTRAKILMEEDPSLVENIKSTFGDQAYIQGKLNSGYLAEKVFNNTLLIEKLNAFVHPSVARDFSSWVSQQRTSYVLKEAALLFESNSYQALDSIILVVAPLELRMKRIMKRDSQRSEQQIKNIIDKQLAVEEAMKLADYIILNDESELIIPQILALHKQFAER